LQIQSSHNVKHAGKEEKYTLYPAEAPIEVGMVFRNTEVDVKNQNQGPLLTNPIFCIPLWLLPYPPLLSAVAAEEV